jgi:hypothetical protein
MDGVIECSAWMLNEDVTFMELRIDAGLVVWYAVMLMQYELYD